MTRETYRKYRPVNTAIVRASLAELRAIATRYQVVNDQLAEIHRRIQHEINDIDQTTPEGRELFEIGKALAFFERPSVTTLTVLTVKHQDFGAVEKTPLTGGVPCAE